ncbi:MAG: recombinase family protein [Planctomycetota bacterium]
MMTVACYVRSSSPAHPDDDQRVQINAWLKANGISRKRVTWFADSGGGEALGRPGLDQLQAAISDGGIEAVVVSSLDRLARRRSDLEGTLTAWSEKGVRMIALAERIQLDADAVRKLTAVMQALTAVEDGFLRERQAAGIVKAKGKQVYTGRKAGTTKGKPERARSLRNAGWTPAEIAAEIGVSERTVFRYLVNQGE